MDVTDAHRKAYDEAVRAEWDPEAIIFAPTRDAIIAAVLAVDVETRFFHEAGLQQEAERLRAEVEEAKHRQDFYRLAAKAEGRRTEWAEAQVEKVRELAQGWAALAPANDWGESFTDTAMADLGRAVLRALDGK